MFNDEAPLYCRGAFLFRTNRYICIVAIQRLSIINFLEQSANHLVLDVRSPSEFSHAHIPGAFPFPLFTDEERKVVGTTYKQEGRQQAIKTGLDYFSPKMRKMVEEVEAQMEARNENFKQGNGQRSGNVFIYCWRGGMRSAAIAWLLDLYGFRVFVLSGGYKAFRNEVLHTFLQPYSFRIIGGYTGSGKTDVLQQLEKNGEQIIDLEAIASHKGSAFGSFNMPPQPTQEMFENLLAKQLRQKALIQQDGSPAPLTTHHSPIWLEDESQRIGNLNIPNGIWQNMRQSPVIFLEIPFDQRLDYIVNQYGRCDTGKLIEAVQRIAKRLGPLETRNTLEFLHQENKKEAFSILLHYYDKLYLKALHNRENLPFLLTRIGCTTVNAENANLISKYHSV